MSTLQRPMWAVSAIGTSNTALSPTVGSGTQWLMDWITVHNTSAGSVTVTWYLVPSGGSPGTSNQIHKHTILADQTDTPDGLRGHILSAGGSVVAIADATGVNAAGTGRLQTLS